MNKITANRPNVAFKGNYMMQGSADALDEVCWYLQKKRKASEHAFDFVDIRLAKQPPTPAKKVFDPANLGLDKYKGSAPVDLGTFLLASSDYAKSILKQIAEKPKVDIADDKSKAHLVVGFMDAFANDKDPARLAQSSVDIEPMDLVVTGSDKHIVERRMSDMLADSLENRGSTFMEKAKLLVMNRTEMDENILHGKPVTNLRANIVKDYLGLKFMEVPILKAQEILERIQRGKFNIETGLSLEA